MSASTAPIPIVIPPADRVNPLVKPRDEEVYRELPLPCGLLHHRATFGSERADDGDEEGGVEHGRAGPEHAGQDVDQSEEDEHGRLINAQLARPAITRRPREPIDGAKSPGAPT